MSSKRASWQLSAIHFNSGSNDYHMAKILQFPRAGGRNCGAVNAQKRWENIPAAVRNLLAGNAYCASCKTPGPIIDMHPFIENGALVIRGRCGACGMHVARMVEE